MENKNTSESLLREFSPHLERYSGAAILWVLFLLGVIGLAVYAFITQVTEGHIVTGMRDNVVWGIYIVNFIFFMGMSYAGANTLVELNENAEFIRITAAGRIESGAHDVSMV